MAGIENFNIVTYTSCIPAEANEVPVNAVKHMFHHGAVLESIQAAMYAPGRSCLDKEVIDQSAESRAWKGFLSGVSLLCWTRACDCICKTSSQLAYGKAGTVQDHHAL